MSDRSLPAPPLDQHVVGRKQAWLGTCVVFLVMLALLFAARWQAAQNALPEDSDPAANSMLIQDAKSFHLLAGNYSRIGFNHPGPAILYFLAGGEYLFYDQLHLTPRPFGGQLLAIAVYSAMWIALLFRLMVRFTCSLGVAAFVTAFFLALTAMVLPDAYGFNWFPYLYYFPFAVFLFALAQLIRGRTDSLCSLTFSWGVLLNGHIAFFPITAVMIAGALLANRSLSQGGAVRVPSLLKRATWRGRVGAALGAIAVLAFLLFPFVVRLFTETPNPLVQYLTYSGGNPWNGFFDSIVFVAHYWGGLLCFFAGFAFLLLAGAWESGIESNVVRSIIAAIIAATIAVGIYAIVGVDDLAFFYVAIFYYSAPIAATSLVAWLMFRKRAGHVILPIAALLLLVPVWDQASTAYLHSGDAKIPDAYTRIRALSPAPMVFDLDCDPDSGNKWGDVWSKLVAVANYAKRQGTQPFVIRKRWQILFTKAWRYAGPPDVLPKNLFYVTSVDVPGAALRVDGLSFLPLSPLLLKSGDRYTMGHDQPDFLRHFMEEGWSWAGKHFVWSEKPDASVRLDFAQPGPHRIVLELGAFTPNGRPQDVDVSANGVKVGHFETTKPNPQKYTFDLPAAIGTDVLLTLHVEHPMRPHEYDPASRDTRKLGISLYSVAVP